MEGKPYDPANLVAEASRRGVQTIVATMHVDDSPILARSTDVAFQPRQDCVIWDVGDMRYTHSHVYEAGAWEVRGQQGSAKYVTKLNANGY